MSIKDLFNQNNKNFQSTETIASSSVLVESSDYIEAKRVEEQKFVPPIDFSKIENFAKFGSAELYYENAFKRIYQEYPYDGTLAEKTEYENSSSYLDRYVFENVYPRTNGHAILSAQGTSKSNVALGWTRPATKEYISIMGGPHTASAGMFGKSLHSVFDKSTIYDPTKGRGSSLEMTATSGSTIEFWLKKPTSMDVEKEVVFDLWNGEESWKDSYGRMTLFLSSSNSTMHLTMRSGSTGFNEQILLANAVDGDWHHYALTAITSSTGTKVDFYRDNDKKLSTRFAGISDINPISYGINATIGSLITAVTGTATQIGDAKLSASLDEFRFWKTARTHEQIANTWFIPVGGGTNKHDSNTDLGVYYKFNEGVVGNSTIDAKVLDYSGRITDGSWIGYSSNARSTTSAIVESGVADREFQDPIIYSTHPDVEAKRVQYVASGSVADHSNNSMFYRYFPAWMVEEDEQNGKQLKILSQIVSSYFDTVWHQINHIDRLHDDQYISGSDKPNPLARNLLQNRGFVVPNLFTDATVTERLRGRDDNEVFEKNVYEVRNIIYQNLYNNITNIYKSKGTEKSFRNFFRAMGIGEDLVKMRLYADDSTYVLRDNYGYKSYERNYINFNYEGNFDGTIFQITSSNNALSYIAAGSNYGSLTFEGEVILPKKNRNRTGYVRYSGLTASLFGYHSALDDVTNYAPAANDYGFSLFAVKEQDEYYLPDNATQRVKFVLSSSRGTELSSSYFSGQYDNNKWTFGLKIKHDKYPFSSYVTGADSSNYSLELVGYETQANIVRNNFTLTSSISGHNFLTDKRRVYAGARRSNFTGSVINETDVKLGYVRYWSSYLKDSAILQHAYDSETFGANEPFESDSIFLEGAEVPRQKTLSLHWAFNLNTGSNSTGEFFVEDLSSGSSNTSYGPISSIIERENKGRGLFFNASATNVIDKNYIYSARKRMPDEIYSSDMVTVKTDEDESFFFDDDASDHFYSFEKSFYGTISDEMMSMFSTALDFNNLIGQPNQRYHHEYNMLSFLKERFYEDVEGDLDFEKFVSFYKWIDDSISIALEQLYPATSRFSEGIRNVVESHVLERNKYVNKIGIIGRRESTEGSIRGVEELLYEWQYGHAPLNQKQPYQNCLWWRERAERETTAAETIKNIKNNHSIQSDGLLRSKPDMTFYQGSTYAIRKLSKPYRFGIDYRKNIHGGTNFTHNKNLMAFYEAIAPAGEVLSVPQNVITVGVGSGQGIIEPNRCEDNDTLGNGYVFDFNAVVGNKTGDEYGHKVKGTWVTPLNLVSGSVHSGYNNVVKSLYRHDVVMTNLHNDIVDITNEIPMQGPYTERFVGGHQSRHVAVNRYDASKSLAVVTPNEATRAVCEIHFATASLSIGDSITMTDSDGTSVTAVYADYYDLHTNRWSETWELEKILTEKLDVIHVSTAQFGFWWRKEKLIFRQASWGTDGNKAVTSTGTEITASNFASGSNSGGQSTRYVNIDSPINRPEAWGLVLKEHPTVNDIDGAFGFVGADYGSALYPNPYKAKATRFREEHAKRPVSVKNIKFDEDSTIMGNYRKGFEVVGTLTTKDQRWWYRKAVADKTDILPPRLRFDHLITPAGITHSVTGGAAGRTGGSNDGSWYLPGVGVGVGNVNGSKMYDADGIEIYAGVTGSVYALGHTTNYMTLFSQLPLTGSESGNVFGPRSGTGTWNSNRQPDDYMFSAAGTYPTGSFEMSGAYWPGLYSDGSFEVSGAYYTVPSSGSFDVSGAYYAGSVATARIKVTGSITAAEKATGGFIAYATDTLRFVNNQVESQGKKVVFAGKNYLIDHAGNSNAGSNFYVATGSDSATYWNNLRAAIVAGNSSADPQYGPSAYQEFYDYQRGLENRTASQTGSYFLSCSLQGLGGLSMDVQNRTFSCWLNLTASGAGYPGTVRYLFKTFDNANKYKSTELYLDETGKLQYKAYFQNGSNFSMTGSWTVSLFENHVGDGDWHHLVVTHKYIADEDTIANVLVFVDGVEVPGSAGAGEMEKSYVRGGVERTNSWTQRINTDGSLYLLNDGSDGTSLYSWRGRISEVAFFKDYLGEAELVNLYNAGYARDARTITSLYPDVLSRYPLSDNDGDATPNHESFFSGSDWRLNLSCSNADGSLASSGFTTKNQGVATDHYALIPISASAAGLAANQSSPITFENGSDYTYFSYEVPGSANYITGGTAQGGAQDGNWISIGVTGSGLVHFIFDDDSTADTTGEKYIQINQTDENMWNDLANKITASTGIGNIQQTIVHDAATGSYCIFHMTASVTGSGYNAGTGLPIAASLTVGELGHHTGSFELWEPFAGGTNQSGAIDGTGVSLYYVERHTGGSHSGHVSGNWRHYYNFIFDNDNTQTHHTESNAGVPVSMFFIQNTGSDGEVWQALKSKILEETPITHINIENPTNAALQSGMVRFQMTSSMGAQFYMKTFKDHNGFELSGIQEDSWQTGSTDWVVNGGPTSCGVPGSHRLTHVSSAELTASREAGYFNYFVSAVTGGVEAYGSAWYHGTFTIEDTDKTFYFNPPGQTTIGALQWNVSGSSNNDLTLDAASFAQGVSAPVLATTSLEQASNEAFWTAMVSRLNLADPDFDYNYHILTPHGRAAKALIAVTASVTGAAQTRTFSLTSSAKYTVGWPGKTGFNTALQYTGSTGTNQTYAYYERGLRNATYNRGFDRSDLIKNINNVTGGAEDYGSRICDYIWVYGKKIVISGEGNLSGSQIDWNSTSSINFLGGEPVVTNHGDNENYLGINNWRIVNLNNQPYDTPANAAKSHAQRTALSSSNNEQGHNEYNVQFWDNMKDILEMRGNQIGQPGTRCEVSYVIVTGSGRNACARFYLTSSNHGYGQNQPIIMGSWGQNEEYIYPRLNSSIRHRQQTFTIAGGPGGHPTGSDKQKQEFPFPGMTKAVDNTGGKYIYPYYGAGGWVSPVGMSGGVDFYEYVDNVITRPRTDLTGSDFVINTRFSAPGGIEVQSIGYLDVLSQTFSAYNSINYRNLSVRGNSGEDNCIRVSDHLGRRRGLNTLLKTHMGRFGHDSTYGNVEAGDYVVSASFVKQQRNTHKRMQYYGDSIITGSRYDNAYISTPIPRSDFQYSWIRHAVSGSGPHMQGSDWEANQRILGWSHPDGTVSSSIGYVESIVFPSSSAIFE